MALHTFCRDVHVDDFPRGVLLPAQSFQQRRVVITQRPSDVVLVYNFPYEILALHDLVLQVEVRKFVFALILTVLGLDDLFGLRKGYPILEVKHTVRRVGPVVFEDLSEGNLHSRTPSVLVDLLPLSSFETSFRTFSLARPNSCLLSRSSLDLQRSL